jgi:capsular polysaccharide biosynthesis protein
MKLENIKDKLRKSMPVKILFLLKSLKHKFYLSLIFIRNLLPKQIQQNYFSKPSGWIGSTLNFCKSQNIPYKILRSGEQSIRKIPHTPENEIHQEFTKQLKHYHPPVWLTKIMKGIVVSQNGIILNSSRYILFDISRDFGLKDPKNHSLFQKLYLPQPRYKSGNIAVLSTIESSGYFHWLTDALPRLAILIEGGIFLDQVDGFIVPSNYGLPAIRQSLELLGITQEKQLSPIRTCDLVECEHLILPSLPGLTGNPAPWVRSFLRDSYLDLAKSIKTDFPTRFYISRKETRRVINEPEIIPLLKKFGFVSVQPEKLSFLEQVALFSKAEVIISPHGAALTNLMFCSEGTKVVELFLKDYVNGCYWAIANLGNINYSYLEGENNKSQKNSLSNACREDFYINPKNLNSWLEFWLR